MLRILLTFLILGVGAVIALWQLDIVQLPFAAGKPTSQPAPPTLFALVKANDLVGIQASIASGAEVDARDELGQTPLMYALAEGADRAVVEGLLDAGADVNATTEAGWTPLMYAARDSQQAEIVQLLMLAGADPTVTNAEGQTAVDLARRNPKVASTRLMPALEELAASPFTRGWPSGYTVPVEGATLSSRASHLPGAPRSYRNGTHEGFDFYDGTVSVEIAYGTPIRAVADGVVVRADHDYVEMSAQEYDEIIATAKHNLSTPPEILDKLRGRQVWIRHPGGFVSRYAHLSGISEGVRVGVRVRQGDLIAATGNSGTLEAVQGTEDDPHPHVEIWRGDDYYLGQGMEPAEIYRLAAQVFGERALPPYTEDLGGG